MAGVFCLFLCNSGHYCTKINIEVFQFPTSLQSNFKRMLQEITTKSDVNRYRIQLMHDNLLFYCNLLAFLIPKEETTMDFLKCIHNFFHPIQKKQC